MRNKKATTRPSSSSHQETHVETVKKHWDFCKECGVQFSSCLCQQKSETPSNLRRRRLWVGGVSEMMSERDLEKLFVPYSCIDIEIRRDQFQNGKGYAFVTFESETIAAEGLKQFFLSPLHRDSNNSFGNLQCRKTVWERRKDSNSNESSNVDDRRKENMKIEGSSSLLTQLDCEKNGMPSLMAQLNPLTETEIRKRLEAMGDPSNPFQEQDAYATGGRLGKKLYLLRKLANCFRRSGNEGGIHSLSRPVTQLSIGKPIRKEIRIALVEELKNIDWGKQRKKSRKGVDAECYMILGKAASDAPFKKFKKESHKRLWELAMICLQEATATVNQNNNDEDASKSTNNDNSFHCTSLAVTRNFRGSPHIDRRDTTFQFVTSFILQNNDGKENNDYNYDNHRMDIDGLGGELCIERDGGNDIAMISSLNKVIKVDGRFVHWVREYPDNILRFSLVWFSVDETARTEPLYAVYEDFCI